MVASVHLVCVGSSRGLTDNVTISLVLDACADHQQVRSTKVTGGLWLLPGP
jgi:hypothetical protein